MIELKIFRKKRKTDNYSIRKSFSHTFMLCTCGVPADFTRLEATLDSYRLFSTVAAEICIFVTDITLLALLYDLVSTDGLITDCPK